MNPDNQRASRQDLPPHFSLSDGPMLAVASQLAHASARRGCPSKEDLHNRIIVLEHAILHLEDKMGRRIDQHCTTVNGFITDITQNLSDLTHTIRDKFAALGPANPNAPAISMREFEDFTNGVKQSITAHFTGLISELGMRLRAPAPSSPPASSSSQAEQASSQLGSHAPDAPSQSSLARSQLPISSSQAAPASAQLGSHAPGAPSESNQPRSQLQAPAASQAPPSSAPPLERADDEDKPIPLLFYDDSWHQFPRDFSLSSINGDLYHVVSLWHFGDRDSVPRIRPYKHILPQSDLKTQPERASFSKLSVLMRMVDEILLEKLDITSLNLMQFGTEQTTQAIKFAVDQLLIKIFRVPDVSSLKPGTVNRPFTSIYNRMHQKRARPAAEEAHRDEPGARRQRTDDGTDDAAEND